MTDLVIESRGILPFDQSIFNRFLGDFSDRSGFIPRLLDGTIQWGRVSLVVDLTAACADDDFSSVSESDRSPSRSESESNSRAEVESTLDCSSDERVGNLLEVPVTDGTSLAEGVLVTPFVINSFLALSVSSRLDLRHFARRF